MSFEGFDSSILLDFIVECNEHLQDVEEDLLTLEKSPDDLELLNKIFRAIHSIKGGSSFLGLKNISTLTHKMENVLDSLRKKKRDVSSVLIDTILLGLDSLILLINELEQNAKEAFSDGNTMQQVDFDSISTVEMSDVIVKLQEILENPQGKEKEDANDETPAESTQNNTDTQEAESKAVQESAAPKVQENAIDFTSRALSTAMATFIAESADSLEMLDQEFIKLESNSSDKELINTLFRSIHNFKGNARYLGLSNTERLSHFMENILDDFRNDKLSVSADIIDVLLQALDVLKELIHVITEKETDTGVDVEPAVAKLQKFSKKSQSQAQPEASKPKSSGNSNETTIIFLTAVKQHLKNIINISSRLDNNQMEDPHQDFALLLRAASGIKSSANYMQFNESKELSEHLEVIAHHLSENPNNIPPNLNSLLKRCSDQFEQIFSSLEETGAEISVDLLLIADLMIEENIISRKPTSAANESAGDTTLPTAPAGEQADESADQQTPEPETKIDNSDSAKDEDVANPQDKNDNSSVQNASSKSKKAFNVEKTIRVDQSKLDSLMNLIGELIISRNSFSSITRKIENQSKDQDVANELKAATHIIGRISDELQSTIMSVRMLPVGTVFNKFTRLVRDLAKSKDKEIKLHIVGEDTELDKTVIEQIGDPLVHLIRNSADHGLETTEERIKAHKEPAGNIYLRAYHEGNNVVIEVEDDGHGINLEKVKKKALQKGLISQNEFNTISDTNAVNLIFLPGFSTADQISNISGRGVGMDVVRSNITKLNGRIFVETKPGKGTKFLMVLPLTLAIVDAIMIRTGNNVFAVPLHAVAETVKVARKDIKTIKNHKTIRLRDQIISVESIGELFDIDQFQRAKSNDELIPIIIITAGTRQVGFIVDELLDKQEIVIKPLVDFLASITGLSGATILGDGSIILIIDPSELVELAITSNIKIQEYITNET